MSDAFKVASGIFGVLGLYIMVRAFIIHPSEFAVGERFVIDEVTLPTSIYTFHFKPITLFTIFGLLYWTLGLEGWKRYIAKIPATVRKLFTIFSILSAFVMGYEFIQNLLMWMSFYIMYGGNLDLLYHQVNPAMPKPVNFNFISKLFWMFFVGALYTIYFFEKIEE